MTISERINGAVEAIRARTDRVPELGLILGSGLGDFCDRLEDQTVIPFSDIPGFPLPTVEGHQGAFVLGSCRGRTVAALRGRIHYYEGYSQQEITLPVRVMAKLGVRTLILTNAAGGINLDFQPGTLMLLTDHINYSGMNPLIGPNLDEFGPRFPDVSHVYTPALQEAARQSAAELGLSLQQGVYMYFPGPQFETPAEVRMARVLGADAVGMSTVPEAIVAAHCGMRVLGFTLCTNMAAGVLEQPLSGDEVIATGEAAGPKFTALVKGCLERL